MKKSEKDKVEKKIKKKKNEEKQRRIGKTISSFFTVGLTRSKKKKCFF